MFFKNNPGKIIIINYYLKDMQHSAIYLGRINTYFNVPRKKGSLI